MTIKMKGLTKGFKFLSKLFAAKDRREIEIGKPTDVKHVAHIGFDGPTGSAPSWMNEFKTAPEFANTSVRGSSLDSRQSSIDMSQRETPKQSKKQRRKKIKSNSSDSNSSSSRSSRAARSKAKFVESTKGQSRLEAA